MSDFDNQLTEESDRHLRPQSWDRIRARLTSTDHSQTPIEPGRCDGVLRARARGRRKPRAWYGDGRLGPPPLVTRLHYVVEGWLRDDLVESFPCFVVTSRLAEALREAEITGYQFDQLDVTVAPELKGELEQEQLPDFLWLKVSGEPGQADLGLAVDGRLVASEMAVAVFRNLTISNCHIEAYSGSTATDRRS